MFDTFLAKKETDKLCNLTYQHTRNQKINKQSYIQEFLVEKNLKLMVTEKIKD